MVSLDAKSQGMEAVGETEFCEVREMGSSSAWV